MITTLQPCVLQYHHLWYESSWSLTSVNDFSMLSWHYIFISRLVCGNIQGPFCMDPNPDMVGQIMIQIETSFCKTVHATAYF